MSESKAQYIEHNCDEHVTGFILFYGMHYKQKISILIPDCILHIIYHYWGIVYYPALICPIHLSPHESNNFLPITKIQMTCNNLRQYYNALNRNYDNLFTEFCEQNGLDDDDSLLSELNETYDQSIVTDFDENFPFAEHPPTEQEGNILKFDLIKRCYHNIRHDQLPKFDDKFFSVTETDTEKIRDILCRRGKNNEFNNENILYVLTIGHKASFDYLHHLVDSWFRYSIKIEIKTKKRIELTSWLEDENNKHFQRLKCIKLRNGETAYDEVRRGITSFTIRQICMPLYKTVVYPLYRINDSLELIVKYLESACIFIATLLSQQSDGNKCPFQFDLCICSSKPQFVGYDNDDYDNDKTDFVGDIEAKLKINRLIYRKEVIYQSDSIYQQRVFTNLFGGLSCIDNQHDIVSKKRLIGFVDRRKAITKGTDTIYLYQPPSDCCQLDEDALTVSYISLSRTCLLPNIGYGDGENTFVDPNINAHCYDAGKSVLTFSFVVKNVDEIKIYLYWMGTIFRFMPQDIYTLLPLIFNGDWNGGENIEFIAKQKNEINEKINHMNQIVKDSSFEAFQQLLSYYK